MMPVTINGSNSGEVVASSNSSVRQVISLTQAAYDAIATKDANTLYVITG